MGIMTDRQSVGANATTANLCAGKTAEFIQEASLVKLFACAAAVGVNVTMVVGEEVVIDDQEINAMNRMPIIPDDFVAHAGAFPGDRVTVRLRNTTGAAIICFTRIETEPA